MTNSYNLSQKPRPELIIIHGMNNNPDAFVPMKKDLEAAGWKTHFLCLPCHGEDRNEAKDFKRAFEVFGDTLLPLTRNPYMVLAFSHGALYFQLWMEKHPELRPLCQVLLAPALYIRRQKLTEKIFKLLPSFLYIKSLSPKAFQRYESLSVREYRILFSGIKMWQERVHHFKVPTLIMIDQKDELVDASFLNEKVVEMKEDMVEFKLWQRPYLKKGPGRHHIMFHPDYFSASDWKKFHLIIQEFLKRSVSGRQ